jgi:hypothetical protein
VDQWLTPAEFDRLLAAGRENPGAEGVIVEREGRFWVDRVPGRSGLRYEVVGGVDVAQARREGAAAALSDNAQARALAERMADSDFVAPGAPGSPAQGFAFAEVFGPQGLHRQGRVFFFEAAGAGAAAPRRALHPLEALGLVSEPGRRARAPEDVVMMVYGGAEPLRRDRFPTLESLEASDVAGDFRRLTVSPRGAAALIENARRYEAAELRRGWLEVKLNSAGFARDESGRVVQLYRSADDFNAQRRAFDHAERDLAAARAALDAKRAAAEAARQAEETARAEYEGGRAESSAFVKASEAARRARVEAANAEADVRAAEEMLRRAGAWTLYRSVDVRLGVDAQGAVVRAWAAPGLFG